MASILLKQPEGKVNDTFSLIKGLSFERNCGAETVESITRQFGLINSELIMFIDHHKEFLQLIFRALALRKTSVSETLHDGRLTSSNRLLKPNYLLFLWVTDWLTEWPPNWLTGWLTNWLIDCWLIDSLVSQLIDWLINLLIDWTHEWRWNWMFHSSCLRWSVAILKQYKSFYCNLNFKIVITPRGTNHR